MVTKISILCSLHVLEKHVSGRCFKIEKNCCILLSSLVAWIQAMVAFFSNEVFQEGACENNYFLDFLVCILSKSASSLSNTLHNLFLYHSASRWYRNHIQMHRTFHLNPSPGEF